MSDTVTPQVGDKVRVIYEGELETRDQFGNVGLKGSSSWHDRRELTAIEVIEKRRPKVGDVVQGVAYEALPVGTIVKDGPALRRFMRTKTDFVDSDGRHWSVADLSSPRKIVYVPES